MTECVRDICILGEVVLFSMYMQSADIWLSVMISQSVTMKKAIPLTHASNSGINFIVD